MITLLQLQINNDERLKMFIRENPIWYKRLNRNPDLYKDFVMDMKEKYHLKPSDRFNKMVNDLSVIQAFLNAFK